MPPRDAAATPDAATPETSVPVTQAPDTDAGADAALVSNPACALFMPVACNFDAPCPSGNALVSGAPDGHAQLAEDAGPDGSSAMLAFVGDGGGIAFFQMPFWDAEQQSTLDAATIPGCRIVCEANLRVASGADASPIVVFDGMGGWQLTTNAQTGEQTSHLGSAQTVAIGSDWTHVRIQLLPGATPSSTLTIVGPNDAGTTTSVPITKIGQTLSFGASTSGPPPSGDVQVYVDDVTCQVSNPVTH